MKTEERWRQMRAYGIARAAELMKEKGWVFTRIEHPRFDFEVQEPEHQLVKVAVRNATNGDGTARRSFMIYHNQHDGQEAADYAAERGMPGIWLLYILKPLQRTQTIIIGAIGTLEDNCRANIALDQ